MMKETNEFGAVGTKHVRPLHNNRISVYCHDYYYY